MKMLACQGLLALFFSTIGWRHAAAQVCAELSNQPFHENFDSLASSGSNHSLFFNIPPEFNVLESGPAANATYTADDGNNSTGDTYSYGSGFGDRALGELDSDTVESLIGACFTNNTGHTIFSVAISYAGEQWRLGAAGGTGDRLDFQISFDATSLTVGTYLDVNALDFVSPVTSGSVGRLNGNAAVNRKVFTPVVIPISNGLPSGGTLYIHWLPNNVSGAHDGLAIDDFTIVVTSLKLTVFSIEYHVQPVVSVAGLAQPPGAGVQFETSADLQSWTPFSSQASDQATGSFEFKLLENSNVRFYRVTEL